MHTPSSYFPGSAPGHKLQKPSKESGKLQSLGTISFVFLRKGKVKRGGGTWYNARPRFFGAAQPRRQFSRVDGATLLVARSLLV